MANPFPRVVHPGGPAFLWYGAQGELPSLFSTLAGWGDVAAGILALVAVGLLSRLKHGARQGYIAFHLFGILDFAVSVGTGFTLSVLAPP